MRACHARYAGIIMVAATVMIGTAFAEDANVAEKDIVGDEIHSGHHKHLSSALNAASLSGLMKSQSAYTLFAPTDAAFAEHQGDGVDAILQGGDKAKLAKFLNCHMIAGKMSTHDMMLKVRKGGGNFDATTMGGCNLNFNFEDGKIVVKDEQGGKAKITASNDTQSGGVVQTVDQVLVPKM